MSYESHRDPASEKGRLGGGEVLLKFEGEKISRIGIRVDVKNLS